MRRTLALLALAAFACTVPALAKPSTVKGAKCTACHDGAPKDKKMNAAAAKMFPKYKEDKCKDCHGAAEGKLTTTDEAKKAAKK
jgi:nitrate/TMAO reductase-like tetraheme cytochrome c subunit